MFGKHFLPQTFVKIFSRIVLPFLYADYFAVGIIVTVKMFYFIQLFFQVLMQVGYNFIPI